MAINTSSVVSNVYAQSYSASSKSTTKTTKQDETTEVKKEEKTKESQNLGRTIGEPKLSKEAQKYYDKLKKKFGNYDFILVSEDQKANAQANAGKYANNIKTVVLIDEDKIERMATDESYRKKYEGILSGASSQLEQLKSSMEKSGANVKGYGMQVNDGGTASFFAVMKKSSSNYGEKRLPHEIEGSYQSISDKADDLLKAYAESYDEIRKGYADGTREAYIADSTSETGYRKLTMEE